MGGRGGFTRAYYRTRLDVYERDGGRCRACGIPTHMVVAFCPDRGCDACYHCSHVIPKTQGGRDTLDNLVVLCRRHSLDCGDQNLTAWLATRTRQAGGDPTAPLPPVADLPSPQGWGTLTRAGN